MLLDCRIIVPSCPRREPIQRIWRQCFEKNWSDCPWSVTIVSPENDVGWNQNLLAALRSVKESFVLMLLDDYFLIPQRGESYTSNMELVLALMMADPSIALIKLQASYAASPELNFGHWSRIKEYDREH